MNRGGRNLLALGIIAIVIAIATTTLSLVIYHNSGDIYLDRSRPGFLPDESEDLRESSKYVFPDSGPITKDSLGEYLEKFNDVIDALDRVEDPFSPTPLSNDSLGIPE